MLLFVSSLKLIAEIALMAIAGQSLLGWLAGVRRERNLFYKVLEIMAAPFVKGMRRVLPQALQARHLPLATFLLLGLVWLALTATKIRLCVEAEVMLCK